MTGPENRKALIAATGTSIATLIPVALHQLGAVHHLPDPPLRVFDSDGITGSKMAHPFGIPDSLLGIVSYTVTLALASAKTENQVASRCLAMKVAFDGALAAANTVRQVVKFRRICSWCMGTVGSSLVSLWICRDLLRKQL
jgi:uncharacterized membrane protein